MLILNDSKPAVKNIVRKIKFIVLILSIKIRAKLFRPKEAYLLIVKTDVIGDYILFRNFLDEIAKSDRYKGKKIILVCNNVVKNFSAYLDSSIIYRHIGVSNDSLKCEWAFVFKQIDSYTYDTVINFHYTQNRLTELLTLVANSNNKICISGNNDGFSSFERKVYEFQYNRRVVIPDMIKSEFDRNKFFAEEIIGKKLNISRPFIEYNESLENRFFPFEKYVVLAVGAGLINRQLNSDKLIKITNAISLKYNICFVGAKADVLLTQQIVEKAFSIESKKYVDLTGKTELKDVLGIIAGALCVICHDSGIYHISIALRRPVLCIAGGGHFDRFVNYVKEDNVFISNVSLTCYNCNWHCKFNFKLEDPYPCISHIDAKEVLKQFSLMERFFD